MRKWLASSAKHLAASALSSFSGKGCILPAAPCVFSKTMCHLKHWSHAKWSHANYCDGVWSGCPSGIAQQARMEISRCLKVLVFLRTWLCKSLTPWAMALFFKTPRDTHPLDYDHGHRTSSFRSIFSTRVWDGHAYLLPPKEERVLTMKQHRQSLEFVSIMGLQPGIVPWSWTNQQPRATPAQIIPSPTGHDTTCSVAGAIHSPWHKG